MENNTPKDVSLTKIEKAHVYRGLTDYLVFDAFDVNISQEYEEQKYRATCDITLTLKGEVTYLGAKQLHEIMEDDEIVRFDIIIRRTDVIQILKYGQFVKMKGSGFISSVSGNIDYWTVIIQVKGNIDIR